MVEWSVFRDSGMTFVRRLGAFFIVRMAFVPGFLSLWRQSHRDPGFFFSSSHVLVCGNDMSKSFNGVHHLFSLHMVSFIFNILVPRSGAGHG